MSTSERVIFVRLVRLVFELAVFEEWVVTGLHQALVGSAPRHCLPLDKYVNVAAFESSLMILVSDFQRRDLTRVESLLVGTSDVTIAAFMYFKLLRVVWIFESSKHTRFSRDVGRIKEWLIILN